MGSSRRSSGSSSSRRGAGHAAAFFRRSLAAERGERDSSNCEMVVIRGQLGLRGLALDDELTHEASVVVSLPLGLVIHSWDAEEQQEHR
jgi:hypothetical protein